MNRNELFDYDPDTGKLYWKISPSDKVKAGQEAGSNDVHGYTQVKVLGVVRKNAEKELGFHKNHGAIK
ncbi:HNH endonuclease [Salmonella phage Jersey]|uniref:HNH endonuclease n=1 Tax=Salmonella phage Jersey TaxID=1340534 RepID=S4X598_9CAUD|nr:HNH endonuclease [Salmonella phage Jersey]AGP24934.1 HNH endonuclease [Salmonella phage Jersey]